MLRKELIIILLICHYANFISEKINGNYQITFTKDATAYRKIDYCDLELEINKQRSNEIHFKMNIVNHMTGTFIKKSNNDNESYGVKNFRKTSMNVTDKEKEDEKYVAYVVRKLKKLIFNEQTNELTLAASDRELHFKKKYIKKLLIKK